MALSAATVWEFLSGGSMNNGGGYVATGTDYSLSASPVLALTDCYHGAGSTTLTSDTGGFTAAMIGNLIKVVSGTNFTVGWYEIKTRVDTNNITVDRSLGASANITKDGVVNVGGALAYGIAAQDTAFHAAVVAGNVIWYSGGNTSPGTTYSPAGNIAAGTAGTAALPIVYRGYKSSRADSPTGTYRPTIACSSYTWSSGNVNILEHLIFTGTGSSVLIPNYYNTVKNCKVANTSTTANQYAVNLSSVNSVHLIGCECSSTKGQAIRLATVTYCAVSNCYLHDSADGVYGLGTSGCTIVNNVIETISGPTTGYGIAIGAPGVISGNTIRNCLTGWYENNTYYPQAVINNIFADNITAINYTTATPSNIISHNCFYGNTTTYGANVGLVEDSVTDDPALTSTIGKGTDGAAVATTKQFTSASAPFGSVTTSDCLALFSGAGTGIKLGVYNIASVDSTSQVTLNVDPTNGSNNISSCVFGVVKGNDFTFSGSSSCLDAGMDAHTYSGVTV